MRILRTGFFTLRVKSEADIELEDFRVVEELSKLVGKVEGKDFRSQVIRADYYRAIVQQLAVGPVRWYHLFYINEILEAVGFLNRVESPEKTEKPKFKEFVAWLGARLNLSERMVLRGFTVDGARRSSIEVMRRELERSLENLNTKVDPSGHLKKIVDRLEGLKDRRAEITGEQRPIVSRGVVGIIGAAMGKM